MEKPEARNKFAAFQAVFSFDPREDIQGLTLYGTGNRPGEGILILQGRFDANRLLTLVRAAKDYTSSNHRSHVIHEWTDEKKEAQGRKDAHTVAAFHSGKLVFGQGRDAVAAALDVLDHQTPSLSSTRDFTERSAVAGPFLTAATRQVDVPDGQPHSALLRQAHYLSLTAGEGAGQMTVQMLARAATVQAAQGMQKIGEGLIALMSLQTNKPAQAALARATRLQQSSNELTATMSLPAADVIHWMRNQAAHKTKD
jgi:hypothetical protein